MTIRYECAECGAVMKIKDELAGRDGTCPKCQASFTIPGVAQETAKKSSAKSKAEERPESQAGDDIPDDDFSGYDEDDDASPPPRRSIPDDDFAASASKRKPRIEREVEDDDFAPPPEKPPAKSSSPTPPAMSAAQLAGSLMLGGAGAADGQGKKRARKQFGEDEERKKNKQSTLFDQLRYNANKIIPLVAGTVVLVVAGYWASSSMMGGSGLPELGHVTGTVMLDGKPLANATVMFLPEIPPHAKKEQTRLAASIAHTDAAGKFTLEYVKDVEGAVVGKHTVQIRARSEQGGELLPAKYNSRTELTATVKSGDQVIPPFDLKSTP